VADPVRREILPAAAGADGYDSNEYSEDDFDSDDGGFLVGRCRLTQ